MVPLEPEALPDLWGVRVIVAAGELDQMVPKENTERLVELLRSAGAEVQVRWQRTGHGLAREEVEEAKRWLSHTQCITKRLVSGKRELGPAGGGRTSISTAGVFE